MAKKEYYIDPMGDKVPARHVKPYDKARDRIATQIAREYLKMQARMVALKEQTMQRVEDLQARAACEAGVPSLGGAKGNVQFRSFDGNVTVTLDRQKRTEFDERLQFAQQLIHEAVEEMTLKGTGADLAEIARRSFQPRRSGNLDMQRIRDLRTYNVKHPKWRQACEIISECERTIGHREYIRVAVRRDRDHKPTPIKLDIAAL